MIKALKSLRLIMRGSEEQLTRVRLTGNVHLTAPDGTAIGGRAGEFHDLTLREANDLHAAGVAEIIGLAEAQAAKEAQMKAYLPKHREPQPPPADFKDLPACFSRHWQLADQIAVAAEFHRAID